MRGISWLAANPLASQEGLCTMEWVSKYGHDLKIRIFNMHFSSNFKSWISRTLRYNPLLLPPWEFSSLSRKFLLLRDPNILNLICKNPPYIISYNIPIPLQCSHPILICSSHLRIGLPLYILVSHTCSPLPISVSLVLCITVIYQCCSLAVNPSTYFCACLPNPDEM